jgi:hypothetical protein
MYVGLPVNYEPFLTEFNETLIFLTDFIKTQIQYFMKIRPLGVELFHLDGRLNGQKNMTKLIAPFRNFVNAPKHF